MAETQTPDLAALLARFDAQDQRLAELESSAETLRKENEALTTTNAKLREKASRSPAAKAAEEHDAKLTNAQSLLAREEQKLAELRKYLQKHGPSTENMANVYTQDKIVQRLRDNALELDPPTLDDEQRLLPHERSTLAELRRNVDVAEAASKANPQSVVRAQQLEVAQKNLRKWQAKVYPEAAVRPISKSYYVVNGGR